MSAIDLPLDSFARVWTRAYIIGRRLLWAATVTVTILVILEAVHLYDLLARVHPILAWTVTGVLATIILGWSGWRCLRYLRNPTVLSPPVLPDIEEGWTAAEQRCFVRFARRYLQRQERNPRLDLDTKAGIPAAVLELETGLAPEDAADPARAALALSRKVETILNRITAPLDKEANRLIRRAAVEVAVATAVSPSVFMDFMITLGRNIDLIARLADLYYGRPGLLGTLKVSRDVLGTAAMAGALEYVSDNVTSALSEVTGSWSARILGPLGQGLVNGVVTLRIGAAARMRCRSTGGTRPRWRIWRPGDYFHALGSLKGMVQERFQSLELEPEEKPGWFQSLFRRSPASHRSRDAAAWESGYDPLLDSDILKEK